MPKYRLLQHVRIDCKQVKAGTVVELDAAAAESLLKSRPPAAELVKSTKPAKDDGDAKEPTE